MAEKCFHSLCASIIPFYLNPWLITLGSKIANVQLSTGILYNVIKNSSSLKIMAIISEVKGCMDPSPAAGSAVREGKEKKECPDHGQETHNLWHSFRKALVRLGFAPASPAFSRNEAFGVTVFLILWSQSFAAAGKLGIKLQATITFSCRDIFWISFFLLINANWLITRVWTDLYVELCTPTYKEKGTLRSGLPHCIVYRKAFPLYDDCSCHTTSQHFYACSWMQLTSHVPSKAQGSSQPCFRQYLKTFGHGF